MAKRKTAKSPRKRQASKSPKRPAAKKKKAPRKPRRIKVADDEEQPAAAAEDAVAAEQTPAAEAQAPSTSPTTDEQASSAELPLATRLKLTHADECRALGLEVGAARRTWIDAKNVAKERKAEYTSLLLELERLAARGPDQQATLNFGDGDAAVAVDPAAPPTEFPASNAPAPDQEEWKQRPLDVLGLSEKVVEKLYNAGIHSLGMLQARWQRDEPLTLIKGIGPETADKITDAWAEYAKTHQELYGLATEEPPAPDAATEDDADPFRDEPADAQEAAPEQAAEEEADDDEDPFADDPPSEGDAHDDGDPDGDEDDDQDDDDPFDPDGEAE